MALSTAVREAIRFAGPCSSKIIAVTAFKSNPEYETAGGSAYDAQVTEAQAHLMAIKELSDKAGVPCETILRADSSPATEVVSEAVARNADMIVIGRRGWKGIAKAFIGEVAAGVAALCFHSPPCAMQASGQKRKLSSFRLATEIAQEEGVPAEGITPTGRSFSAIVEAARGRGVDLIVMGTYGKSGLRKAFLGSATEKVIGTAGCAVLVLKAKA